MLKACEGLLLIVYSSTLAANMETGFRTAPSVCNRNYIIEALINYGLVLGYPSLVVSWWLRATHPSPSPDCLHETNHIGLRN